MSTDEIYSYMEKRSHPDLFSSTDKDTYIGSPNWSGTDIFDGLQIDGRPTNSTEALPGYDNDTKPGTSPIIPGTKAQNGLSPETAEAWGAGITAINLLSKMIRDHKNQPTTKPLGKAEVKEARNKAVSKYLNPKKKKKKKYFA